MTIYLSLQVSGGTPPDPQPLSQLLICLYGFILCVKPAHNSITVRVTKLSPECHKRFSLLMAASRGSTVTPPRQARPSPAFAWLSTSSCRKRWLVMGSGSSGARNPKNDKEGRERGHDNLRASCKVPTHQSPAYRGGPHVFNVDHGASRRVDPPLPSAPEAHHCPTLRAHTYSRSLGAKGQYLPHL